MTVPFGFIDSEDPISPPGVKDKGLLESAIARPFMTVGGKDAFPSVLEKSAALFHGIISNHSFYNGNKRTALLATLYFLGDNGYIVNRCDDDEMFEFTRKVAAHDICNDRNEELSVIRDWLDRNSRKQIKGEKRLKFNELKDILTRFNYQVIDDKMNFEIKKDDEFITKIMKKGMTGKDDYDQVYLSELRRRLSLTAEYGIDSAMFYGNKGVAEELNEFMEMRSEVMRKLAKI